MEAIKRTRLMAVRISLALTGIGALLLYPFGMVVVQGFLLGGLAGTLGFWLLARKVEQFAEMGAHQVQAQAMKWMMVRMVIYGAVLYRAFTLDQENYYGLLAATGGILVMRLVMLFLAFTGLDLKRNEN